MVYGPAQEKRVSPRDATGLANLQVEMSKFIYLYYGKLGIRDTISVIVDVWLNEQ